MPLDIESYINKCTEQTSNEAFQATVSAVSSQFHNDIIWASALSTNEKNVTVQDSEKIPPVSDICLDIDNSKQAQRQDAAISKVLRYKEQGLKPCKEERSSDSHPTKILSREWDKLYIDKEGFLHRKTSEYDQKSKKTRGVSF